MKLKIYKSLREVEARPPGHWSVPSTFLGDFYFESLQLLFQRDLESCDLDIAFDLEFEVELKLQSEEVTSPALCGLTMFDWNSPTIC